MRRALLYPTLIATSLVVTSLPSAAQQVVHALTGTVSSIDAGKTITVFQDNGSTGEYQDMTNGRIRTSFDKRIAAETTPAATFNHKGAYAIVFYYGEDDRTAVAIKSLGAGPFTSVSGTVKNFDGHTHSIAVQDDSGSVQTFKIDDHTVAEGMYGAVPGVKLQPVKGDHVRIVASKNDDTALFLRDN